MSSARGAWQGRRPQSAGVICQRLKRSILILLATAGTAHLVGCNAEETGLAPVRGTVTLNGKPVTHGHVFARPTDGRPAVGRIRSDGTYTLGTYTDSDGAKVGQHTVTLAPPRADEGSPPSDAVVPPARYNSPRTSGLQMVVPPEGLTNHRIELEATEAEMRAAETRTDFVE